jgi:hypothetical protein
MLRFFVTIIEKFCHAQPERKGDADNPSVTGRAIDAISIPTSNREPKMRRLSVSGAGNEMRGLRAALSNRELNLLERKLSHCKQTNATGSNRELSTICKPAIVNRKALENSEFSSKNQPYESPLNDGHKSPLLPCMARGIFAKDPACPSVFLPGSNQNVECDVTSRKQSPEKFLPGATTTLSRYTELRYFHAGKPSRIPPPRAKMIEHSLLLSPRNFIGLQDRDCRSVRLTVSAQI